MKKTQVMKELDAEFEKVTAEIGQELQEMLLARVSPLLRRLEAIGPEYEESRFAQYLTINRVIARCLPTYREVDECAVAACMADLITRFADHSKQTDPREFLSHIIRHMRGPEEDPMAELLRAMGFDEIDVGIPGARGFRGGR